MSRRPLRKPPAYRLQKARGLAVVRIDGNDQYLGPYGSPESHEKYARLIGEWRQRQGRPESSPSEATTTSFTVAELTLAYWKQAAEYYESSSLDRIRVALRSINALYATTEAAERLPSSAPVGPRIILRTCQLTGQFISWSFDAWGMRGRIPQTTAD